MLNKPERPLPYGRQLVDDDDVAAVVRVLRGDYLTTGPATAAFERALAEQTGAQHAVSCSSGTAALHLAALAVGLAPGDRVIVPAITFLATANVARFVGAEVTFADVDRETGLMRASDLAEALGRSGRAAKAVFPVHLAGQPVDMAAVSEVAKVHGLRVVEDACHALGTLCETPSGPSIIGNCRYSDMAAFSFHPVKMIAMGEGGAVTTNDPDLARRAADLRNHGMIRRVQEFANADLALDADGRANPWYYEMIEPGFNYRASDIHCALGLSQLAKLDRFVAARRDLVAAYDEALASLAPLVRPAGRTDGAAPGWHLYVVLIDFASAGVQRATVMRRMADAGIGTQVHYIPVHLQPYYRARYGKANLPGAVAYYERCLSLPLFPGMEHDDVLRVRDALARSLDLR